MTKPTGMNIEVFKSIDLQQWYKENKNVDLMNVGGNIERDIIFYLMELYDAEDDNLIEVDLEYVLGYAQQEEEETWIEDILKLLHDDLGDNVYIWFSW